MVSQPDKNAGQPTTTAADVSRARSVLPSPERRADDDEKELTTGSEEEDKMRVKDDRAIPE